MTQKKSVALNTLLRGQISAEVLEINNQQFFSLKLHGPDHSGSKVWCHLNDDLPLFLE